MAYLQRLKVKRDKLIKTLCEKSKDARNMKKLKSNSAVSSKIIILSVMAMLLCASFTYAADEAREVEWDELVPKGWNPNSVFDKYTDEEYTNLSDEEYLKLQIEAQAMLDEAPTVEALDGETVRIPGFILPLEFDETSIKEFLLVPYFGACIHTPPPPANQVIHGKLDSNFEIKKLFEPVWITGKMKTLRAQQTLGESGFSQSLDVETGYTMEVEEVIPYVEEG